MSYWWDDEDDDEDYYPRWGEDDRSTCETSRHWDAPDDTQLPTHLVYPGHHGVSCKGHRRYLSAWQVDHMEGRTTMAPTMVWAHQKWISTIEVSDRYL